ncbi:MAG: DUF1576 domain-containing protein [Defluviitaleaceae bacterium]|nr:DUF1576 domain-containing protein [Defluviitaleaceae bacterium]
MQEHFFKKPYRVHSMLFCLFIVAGLAYATPIGVFEGLVEIFSRPDILVHDYIHTGGFGATLVNVGLSGLLAVGSLVLAKHEPSGLTKGTLWLVIGLAFFGKNPTNMLPIIVGGFLYAIVNNAPMGDSVLRAMLATCLAPAVTQLAHVTNFQPFLAALLGVTIGLLIGYLINPLALHMFAAHKGFTLYNVGFTAGIIGMGIYAIFRLFGLEFDTLDLWSKGYSLHLKALLGLVSLYYIVCGSFTKTKAVKKFRVSQLFQFHKYEIDFFKEFEEKAYINMGIIGLACLAYMWLIGGEYNGPVIGAILSVVGFGAFGKALFSSIPIVMGATLAALINQHFTGIPYNSGGFLVAIFFSTCLAPLCKSFGIWWGFVAGILHCAFAITISPYHGGMNLYNNGMAGGLTAMILVPIILFFKEA